MQTMFHLQKLPIQYYDTHVHGDIMSRFTNDSDLLIEYSAQIAAGQNPQTLINTKLSKVVYADIIL